MSSHTLNRAQPFMLADWETAAQGELEPEYVLFYLPPVLFANPMRRWGRAGWWELLTIADYRAGEHASDKWTLDARAHLPTDQLATWVRHLVGFPVALQPDTELITPIGRRARTYRVPLYWVRRNT